MNALARFSITGERKFEKEEKYKKYHRLEKSHGSFYRSFTLPDEVSGEQVKADFKDCMPSADVTKDKKIHAEEIQVDVT